MTATQTTPPAPLREQGIDSFRDVTRDNYAGLCALYGVDDIQPLPAAALSVDLELGGGQQVLLALPQGYEAVLAGVASVGLPAPSVTVGRQVFAPGSAASLPLDDAPSPIPVRVEDGDQATVQVKISCVPSLHTMDAWRVSIYRALVQGYERQLAASRGQASPPQAESLLATAGVSVPVPVGSVLAFAGQLDAGQGAGNSPIEAFGWMRCDGRALQAELYPELFAVLGYAYGGSGAQFNIPTLPDMQAGTAHLPYIIKFTAGFAPLRR